MMGCDLPWPGIGSVALLIFIVTEVGCLNSKNSLFSLWVSASMEGKDEI